MNGRQAALTAQAAYAWVASKVPPRDTDRGRQEYDAHDIQFHKAMARLHAEIHKGEAMAAALKEYAARADDRALALATGSHGSGLDPLEAIHALNEAGSLLAEIGRDLRAADKRGAGKEGHAGQHTT